MQTDKLLAAIRESNMEIIDDILGVAIERKRELYPDWEIFYCAEEKGRISAPEDMIHAAWMLNQSLKAKYG